MYYPESRQWTAHFSAHLSTKRYNRKAFLYPFLPLKLHLSGELGTERIQDYRF
jgi:hypothetical protein